VTQHDQIADAALDMQEEFQALIRKYDDQAVVIQAVTGILATVAYAASNSPDEARDLVKAIAAEATRGIDDMYEFEQAGKNDAGRSDS
jgi:hypothetical protein